MKNYAMYYSYKSIGDVLIIIFDNSLKPTRNERINNVIVIYHDEQIIGYNIFDIKEIIKIKNEGMIYLPSETFLNIVNSILINAKQLPLEKKESSGYVVMEVIEINSKEITFNNGLKTKNDFRLNVGNKVVVALPGTFLNNGQLINECHICTNHELGIKDKEEKILILDKDEKVGEDFFAVEG